MQQWPTLRRVLTVWATLTVLVYLTYIAYLRIQPPDELVMASTRSFQALVGVVIVGLPSLIFLFLFLFIGSMAKRWLGQRPQSQKFNPGHAPAPRG
jgi:hypothetical protein